MGLLSSILSDQVARLKNVAETVTIAAAKALNTTFLGAPGKLIPAIKETADKKLISSVGGTTGKAIEFVANNPATTALIGATAVSSAGRAAVSSVVSKTSIGTKAAAVAGTIIVAPALISSSKAQEQAINVIGSITPEKLVSASSQAGSLIDNPSLSSIGEFLKSNALTLGVVGGTALIATGAAAGAAKLAGSLSQAKAATSLSETAEKLVTSREDLINYQMDLGKEVKEGMISQEDYQKKFNESQEAYNAQFATLNKEIQTLKEEKTQAVAPVVAPIATAKKSTAKKKTTKKKKKPAKKKKKPAKKKKKSAKKKKKPIKKKKSLNSKKKKKK